MATIGVPIKVLHEAEGHVVTVETTTGEVSCGYLWGSASDPYSFDPDQHPAFQAEY
jgi:hypothetical protein